MKILIDRASIHKNPNAGRGSFLVPGRSCTVNGVTTRQVQRVFSITPEPTYFFTYLSTNVECDACNEVFDHSLLEGDSMPGVYSESICPKCGAWDCCELEFESITEVENAFRI